LLLLLSSRALEGGGVNSKCSFASFNCQFSGEIVVFIKASSSSSFFFFFFVSFGGGVTEPMPGTNNFASTFNGAPFCEEGGGGGGEDMFY
jgi:hypothetical protein